MGIFYKVLVLSLLHLLLLVVFQRKQLQLLLERLVELLLQEFLQ